MGIKEGTPCWVLTVHRKGKGVDMPDGEAGCCSKAEWTVHKNTSLMCQLLPTPLRHPLRDTGKGPRSFCNLQASPGSFIGAELECVERSATN